MKTRDLLKVCGTAIGVCVATPGGTAHAGVIGFSVVQIVEATMMDPPWPIAFARGVSPDGAVIVGHGSGAAGGFRWTRAVQSLAIDTCPVSVDASLGGAVIVGHGSGGPQIDVAVRWTALGGLEPLPTFGPLNLQSSQGVSDNGVFIVGRAETPALNIVGFVWDSVSMDASPLAPLLGATQSEAHAISGDGQWIGGVSGLSATLGLTVQPFQLFDPSVVCTVWPNVAPYTPQPLIVSVARGAPPALLPGRVTRLNHTGSVAVGGTFAAPGVVAFIHHRPSGTTLVPGHPGGFGQTEALGVSANGRRAVGAFEGGPFGQGAWLWDARGGVIDLQQLLAAKGVLPPNLAAVISANDISADGTVIAAHGLRDMIFSLEPLEITIPAPCQGDANGDFVVDFNDLAIVLGNWLNDYNPFPGTGPGDANLDGVVDFNDLASVLGNWLDVCGGPQK